MYREMWVVPPTVYVVFPVHEMFAASSGEKRDEHIKAVLNVNTGL